MFKAKNFQDALHYYTLAIMFAESGTQDLGLAFGNRSAVFVQLENPQAALEDIDLAFLQKYPEASMEKLRQRQSKCQKSILAQQAADDKNSQLIAAVQKEVQSRKSMRDKMLMVENPNPLLPAAAKCVEIKFDSATGRYLMVNEDVRAGNWQLFRTSKLGGYHEELRF